MRAAIARPISRLTLAGRLTLAMLLVATVAMAGLIFELDRANRAEIERLQTTALQHSARDLAQRLDDLVRSETSRVANLALSRAAQQFIAARPDQRADLYAPTLADFSNFLSSNRPFYRAVLLLDATGEALVATDGSYLGRSFAGSSFFQAARRGELYMSDPGISPLDRQPVIWLAAPVLVDNHPAGVVALALSAEELWVAVEQARVGVGGYAMLLDGYGIRLAHGRDRRYIFRSLAPLPPDVWRRLRAEGRFADLPRIVDTASQALQDHLHRDARQTLIAAPGPGVARVYYSAARLDSRNWTVVTMLSEREVLAPATGATLRSVGVTMLVVVALGLTVAWASRRLLRPVPQLAAAASRIATGDLTTPVAVAGSSEVRALAANFETMRRQLGAARAELAAWASTLEQRVALRSNELAALSELVALSSRNRSSALLLRTALDRSLPVVNAEMGAIWLADAEGGLSLACCAGFDRDLQAAIERFTPGEGLVGQVQMRVEPLALDDISQSPRLSRAIVRQAGLHAFAAAPLAVGRRSLGVFGVYSRATEAFSSEAVALVTAIGQQIALALENIALLGQIEAQARSVAALYERERLAGEIHDGVAQNLSYLYLQLDQLAGAMEHIPAAETQARLANLQRVLEATTAEVRQLIARLQDSPPAGGSLAERLREEVVRLGAELGLEVAVSAPPEADLTLPPAQATEIRRIVGEALRNARNHGRSRRALVELRRDNGQAMLRVSDDGAGFDPDVPPDGDRPHFGLKVMRARAARIGGELIISSRPGAGTRVELTWPAEPAREAAVGDTASQAVSLG